MKTEPRQIKFMRLVREYMDAGESETKALQMAHDYIMRAKEK